MHRSQRSPPALRTCNDSLTLVDDGARSARLAVERLGNKTQDAGFTEYFNPMPAVSACCRNRSMRVLNVLRLRALLVALVLLGSGALVDATAATVTWTGGGADGNWSNSLNWTNGTTNVVPAANDALVFAGTTRLTSTND